MIRNYLQLARLPNVFTAPTNVMAGYLTITSASNMNLENLGMLMASSALLYVSGIIFNDYFDIEIDRKERPSRPLPSGSISKKSALRIAVALMAVAAVISALVSWLSLAVLVCLCCAIIGYDYRLKYGSLIGPATMGGTRFLNVILGATPLLSMPSQQHFFQPFFAAGVVFAFVITITLFSKKEISGSPSRRMTVLFLPVYAIAGTVAAGTMLGIFNTTVFTILVPFIVIQSVIFKQIRTGEAGAIQGGIKWMVISIIILDSVFVSGTAGLFYGLLTLPFLAPAILLSRKFYVT